jgi:predicted PurR-regulated permease PerM
MSGIAVEIDPAVPEKSEAAEPIVAVPVDTTIVSAVAEREEMPLPTDPRTVFLGGLFLLACLTAMYVASDIILPVVLAIVLKLLLQPLVRVLDGFHVPRALGAVVAVLLLIGVFAGLGTALTRPAIDWAGKLPDALPRIEEEMRFFSKPIQAVQNLAQRLESIASGPAQRTAPQRTVQPPQQPQPSHGSALLSMLFISTRAVMAGFFTTILVLFYLLVSGETFLRRLVEILPRFDDKRRAVEISLHVERDVSAYLVTITVINAGVGAAAGCVMWLCGVGDALLWGCIAFVLNYVPILGPIVGVALFAIVGLLSLGPGIGALLPAALYFLIHIAEGEFITPMVVARRFTVNPVAVVLGLVFWYWMWGVPGAILAVPMLAIIKIVCDDLPPLRAFGHFLEG